MLSKSKLSKSNKIAWVLTLISLGTLAASVYPMAKRIGAFNSKSDFPQIHFEPQKDRLTSLRGFPSLRLTDVPPDQMASPPPQGLSGLKLEYPYTKATDATAATPPGRALVIPVKSPAAYLVPSADADKNKFDTGYLERYSEWVAVLGFFQTGRTAQGDQFVKPGTERLWMIVRRTPEGFDPAVWGTVRRSEWVFDIYDLKPDGTMEMSVRRWPRTYVSEYGLKKLAQEESDKPDRQDQIKAARELLKIAPLEERSMEYQAAMFVIPKLKVPEYKFSSTAFSIDVLGWTLPVSMLSFLVLTCSLFFAIAPALSAPKPDASKPARVKP